MGDSSYMAPDLQPVHDICKSNTLKDNHVGQNGQNIGENHATSVEKESLLQMPSNEGGGSCSAKAPLRPNGYHAEMEKCKTYTEKLESEAAQVDMSTLDINGSLSSHEAREGDESRDCSLLPLHFQEGMHGVTKEETVAGVQVNASHEDPAENQVYARSSDSSNVVLVGDTMEDENVISSNALMDNIIRGDEDEAPSKAVGDSEKAEESSLKEKDGVEKETESVTESSTPPGISTENNLENIVQTPLFHSASESVSHKNEVSIELGGDLEVTSLSEDVHTVSQNEVNLNKAGWPDQGCGVTMIISSDLEGWHRFDAEEANATVDHIQGSGQKLELWEKLLDDGPPSQLVIAPSPFEDYKFRLASPGNPFTEEGVERVSSFSEADGFVQNTDLPSSGRLSHSFEKPSFFQWREGQFRNVSGNDSTSSVVATVDGETNGVQRESSNEHGSNLDLRLSSRKTLSSFDATEPFEAPSFMSLVDPKSRALFGASMPTFQVGSTGYEQENSGGKWVANFDLMAPSTQEISRSSSMPRSGGEPSGQWPGQHFSFGRSREQEPTKKESDSAQAHRTTSGFLSPKLSPFVQKVVDRVRTTPAVANGVINSVRQGMSPKTSDKKPTSKSLFARCICW